MHILLQIEHFENEIQRNGGGTYTLHRAERKKDADREGFHISLPVSLDALPGKFSPTLLLFLTDNTFRLVSSFPYPKAFSFYFIHLFSESELSLFTRFALMMVCEWLAW